MIGACDVCNKQDAELSRALCAGIETYACEDCCECSDAPKGERKPELAPGPWTVEKRDGIGGEVNIVTDANGRAIAAAYGFNKEIAAMAAAPQLRDALDLGEEVSALTIAFIEKACGQTADWLDAGTALNDKILEFRRARAVALAKTEKV